MDEETVVGESHVYQWIYFGILCPLDNFARPHLHQLKGDKTIGPIVVSIRQYMKDYDDLGFRSLRAT